MLAKKKKTAEAAKENVLSERNRLALAFMILSRDKTFQKMPAEKKVGLVKEIINIGDEVASWLKAEYGTNDPRKVAGEMGLKVFGEDNGMAKKSEYRQDKMEIVISRDFHNKLLKEVKSKELSEHLLKFVVAHELFKHLEMDRIGEVYKRYKFVTWHWGPFKKERQIKSLSYVAAQAFTQSLLGLDISPEVFDYLTYILYSSS